MPRLAFINKMDRTCADFDRVAGELRRKLGANAWPIVLPIGAENGLVGQIDVIGQRLLLPDAHGGLERLPLATEHLSTAKRALARRTEALAELDEDVADAFLREQGVTPEVLHAAVRRQTLAGWFVPVLGGSAFKNVGVPALLDAVVAYLPSPLDRPPAESQPPDTGETVVLPTDPHGPVCALAFKLWSDRHKGRVVFVRVYSVSYVTKFKLPRP